MGAPDVLQTLQAQLPSFSTLQKLRIFCDIIVVHLVYYFVSFPLLRWVIWGHELVARPSEKKLSLRFSKRSSGHSLGKIIPAKRKNCKRA